MERPTTTQSAADCLLRTVLRSDSSLDLYQSSSPALSPDRLDQVVESLRESYATSEREIQRDLEKIRRLARKGKTFPLAWFCSQIPTSIHEEVFDFINPVSQIDTDFRIIPRYYYYNCTSSELYLEDSINRGDAAIVYQGLLLKGYGHIVGLCYKTTTNGSQTFVRGFWYRPEKWREYAEAISRGVTVIPPKADNWILARPCLPDDAKKLLPMAEEFAAKALSAP